MTKRKNTRQEQEQGGQSSKEEKKCNNPEGDIVLGVYLHCQACAQDVFKSLRGFHGVEIIETDSNNNKVTVKGKKADPAKVAERLHKKTGKHVQLISPLLLPPKDVMKTEKKETKKQEPKVVEAVLKVYLHCQGCAKDVKQCIHKMHGVYTVEANMEKSSVTVKGAFEAEKLVEFVTKRAGKHVVLVKSSTVSNKLEAASHDTSSANDKVIVDPKPINHQYYPRELVYAPQLFSDENPNSCSVM